MKTIKDLMSEYFGLIPWTVDTADDLYWDYLVNEFIPKQGYGDMQMFVSFKLNPIKYFIWKLVEKGVFPNKVITKEVLKESGIEGKNE